MTHAGRHPRHPLHPVGLSTSSEAISMLPVEIALPLTAKTPAGGTRFGRYLSLGFIQWPHLRRVW
jgi:hypothetical protein